MNTKDEPASAGRWCVVGRDGRLLGTARAEAPALRLARALGDGARVHRPDSPWGQAVAMRPDIRELERAHTRALRHVDRELVGRARARGQARAAGGQKGISSSDPDDP